MGRQLAILLVCLSASACVRSDLPTSAGIDCEPGVRVVIDNNAFCVYEEDRPEECPAALPNRHTVFGALLCSVDADTPEALLEAALIAARGTPDTGWRDTGLRDTGLRDTGLRDTGAPDADRRPFIVDASPP